MISIIICSVDKQQCQNIEHNIRETIGCEFEILIHDNRIQQSGLCRVYNTLAKKAKGDFLCFCHEDIKFLTNNWGIYLSEFAYRKNTGVIGFAGAGSMFGYAYWNDTITSLGHCIQGTKDKKILHRHPGMPFSGPFAQALVLDGLCLFCRKDIWEEYPFDQDLFQGFHMYDMDFCMAVAQKYHNYVSYNIDLVHYSQGNMDKAFFIELEKYNKKWKRELPLSVIDYSKKQWLLLLKKGLKNTIKDLYTCTDFSSLHILYYTLKSLQVRKPYLIWTAIKYSLRRPK